MTEDTKRWLFSTFLQLASLAALLVILWAIKHEVKDQLSLVAHIQSVNRRAQFPPLPQEGAAGGIVAERQAIAAQKRFGDELEGIRATLEYALAQQNSTISNIMQKQVEQSKCEDDEVNKERSDKIQKMFPKVHRLRECPKCKH